MARHNKPLPPRQEFKSQDFSFIESHRAALLNCGVTPYSAVTIKK